MGWREQKLGMCLGAVKRHWWRWWQRAAWREGVLAHRGSQWGGEGGASIHDSGKHLPKTLCPFHTSFAHTHTPPQLGTLVLCNSFFPPKFSASSCIQPSQLCQFCNCPGGGRRRGRGALRPWGEEQQPPTPTPGESSPIAALGKDNQTLHAAKVDLQLFFLLDLITPRASVTSSALSQFRESPFYYLNLDDVRVQERTQPWK